MSLSIFHKNKIDFFLMLFIAIDSIVLLVIFLHTQYGLDFFFPVPGTKLNNPLAALLAALFLRGVVNPGLRETWTNRLIKWSVERPRRYYFFGFLFLVEILLEMMWFLFPENFHWNLNAEQGYGTHFSTIQLFFLGIFVLTVSREVNAGKGIDRSNWPWYFVASLFFFLALDDCVGIHENFIRISQNIDPKSVIFHFIHEWLWFYGPFILVVTLFLARFFFNQFKKEPVVMVAMFVGLCFWVSVIVLEGLAKNIVDPVSLDYSRLLIGIEEGAEMLGATLFFWGFSQHLRIYYQKSPKAIPVGR